MVTAAATAGRPLTAAEFFLPNLRGWRQVLLQCTAAMDDQQLHWVPPGGVNSAAWCVRHLAQSEDWFVNAVILQKNMQPRRSRELATREALFGYLQAVWAHTDARMAEWDMDYLLQPRTMPPGFRGTPAEHLTVLWVVNQMIQHFAYHTGQVRMLARLMGVEPGGLG
ncbi:DinB family protein [Thermaerobacter sp. PB12/4term]|uniref:DinB family protein n=1 Tax=Thermaerobacter sp. PB12/4term TaxID=2293838 RepID=UPI000E32627D|nr:DinB family protein [Thermaerobacter sp. PB12/4term]QIA27238.1 DinB family protein [Thermaerobacter sp. PB12/4term]